MITRTSTAQKPKPLWWGIILFVLSLLYLFPEIIFNAKLVSVAGSPDNSEGHLRSIELFGRAISGIGMSLLIGDTLLKGNVLEQPLKSSLFLILITALVWPATFFGQKWLVDNYLIENSTPEQRQTAVGAQLVRSALAQNAVKIEGVPYNPDKASSPEEMTFLALIGGMIYVDGDLLKSIDNDKSRLLKHYLNKKADDQFDEHYGLYKLARDEVRISYKNYLESSNSYYEALDAASDRTNRILLETKQNISDQYSKYEKAKKAFEVRAEARAQKLAPEVYSYFEKRARCFKRSRSERCAQRVDNAYDRKIKKFELGYVHPNHWLITRKLSTSDNFKRAGKEAIGSLGTSLLARGIDKLFGGGGGFKEQETLYTNEVSHYKERIIVLMTDDFANDTGGIPYGINSKAQFRRHEAVNEKTRKRLVKEGLDLPSGWTLSNTSQLHNAVAKKVKKEADIKWKSGMTQKDLTMPPGLTWNDFQVHNDIQKRFKQKMGDYYISPTRSDWNDTGFQTHVIKPNVERQTKEWLDHLKAQLPEFADGGRYEDVGKSALRATLVPPISMSLSLILVILTLLKLPNRALGLIRHNAQMKAWERDIPTNSSKSLFEDKSVSNHKAPEQAQERSQGGSSVAVRFGLVAASGLSVLVLVFGPIYLLNNNYTSKGSTVHYFLGKIEERSSPVASGLLNWVINVQPRIQPVGHHMDAALKITNRFKGIEHYFDELDNYVFHGGKEPAMTFALNESGQLSLTVTSNVPDAIIRIMNIKPTYKDGIKLRPGDYVIEVSAPGHKAQRKWIALTPEKTDFHVDLVKKGS